MGDTKVAGDWWCPNCKEALDGSRVTFQERCDTCGQAVEWIEAAVATEVERLRAELTRLRAELEEARGYKVEADRLAREWKRAESERDALRRERAEAGARADKNLCELQDTQRELTKAATAFRLQAVMLETAEHDLATERAARERAERERELFAGRLATSEECRNNLSNWGHAAESRVRVLTEALGRYGQHEGLCHVYPGNWECKCTCGFDAALAAPPSPESPGLPRQLRERIEKMAADCERQAKLNPPELGDPIAIAGPWAWSRMAEMLRSLLAAPPSAGKEAVPNAAQTKEE